MKFQRHPDVTLRSIALGSILACVNCYWIILMLFWNQGHPTVISLFFNVIFTLFILSLINLLLRRYFKTLSLTRGELLTIYVMLSVASTMGAQDMIQVLIPTIPHPFWFATPENEWSDLFWRYIPKWLSVSDKAVLKGYFMGESTLYTSKHIKAWLTPILSWSLFIFALIFVMLCLTTIFRRRWVEEEKLSYPIIQLPLEMTEPSFFKNRLMWLGFTTACLIDLVNGLHYLFPAVPGLGGEPFDVSVFFTRKPWNAIGWTPMGVYPFVVGLGFFIPLDLSFSCWVFYLFWKWQRVASSFLGLRSLPRLPYIEEQSFGAYIALCLVALWMSRRHLMRVAKRIIGIERTLDDSSEPMPYRWAGIGIILGMGFISGFCYRAGMSLWVVLLFFVIYYALSIAIARIRAELGSPIHDLPIGGPGRIISESLGTKRLGAANLTMLAYLFFFNRGYRGHPMPHQLEGFKIAERTGMNSRKLLIGMLIAVVLGVYVSSWAFLHCSYELGATANWRPRAAFLRLQRQLSGHIPPDLPAVGAMIGGLSFTLFLTMMRMRFLWWKLHPAGYAVSGTWGMNHYWLSIFTSWALKSVILKHGGLKTYRKAVPFFLGLILGEFFAGSMWAIIGIILKKPMYKFLW